MLKNILSGKTCAQCRYCCLFDDDDLGREAPFLTDEFRKMLSEEYPDAETMPVGNYETLKMTKQENTGLYPCSMLTDKGCALGDKKPFDCRIWPFRIMRIGGALGLVLMPDCGGMGGKTVNEIRAFLNKEQLAEKIFDYAEKNPGAVKPYADGVTVFALRYVK